MTDDDRMTGGFVSEILAVLELHGYHRSNTQHTRQAIGLLGDLAHVYEGTLDAPRGAYVAVPSPPTPAQLPSPVGRDAVILPSAEVSTIFAALDNAADYKRDRAAGCADCANQTCLTCQSRLRDAQAYDRVAAQILHAEASAAAAELSGPDRAEPAPSQPQAAPDREVGQ